MTINFDKYAQTGKTFVQKIASELGDKNDTPKASRVLRSTLHVLRNQSTTEESIQFISQLPMFIKAIYVDGWKPGSPKGRVRSLADFISAVQEENPNDYTNQEGCFLAIQAIFRVIREYASEGEIEDLKLTLPQDLRILFSE